MGKRGPKPKNKTKKSNVFLKILSVLVVVGIVGLVGYSYIISKPLIDEKTKEITEITEYLKNNVFSDTDISYDGSEKKLNLINNLEGYSDITIFYKSKNEELVSNTGIVNFPTFSDGDKTVEIEINYEINNDNFFFNLIWGIIGKTEATKIELTIKALGASPLEKINIIEAGLIVPKETSCNIGLLKEDNIFSSVSITWKSSDENIITSEGIKKGTGSARLTATLKCEEVERTYNFDINVLNDAPLVKAIDLSFDNYNKNSYSGYFNKDDIVFVNNLFTLDDYQDRLNSELSEAFDKVARLKATVSNSAYFYSVKGITNPRSISFTYNLTKSDSGKINKDSFINVYYSIGSQENWTLLSKDKITSDIINYKKDLNIDGDVFFKVEFTTDYSELRLDIDDFIIERKVNITDVKMSLVKDFQTKFSVSRPLPLTTYYGGEISWESSDNSILSTSGLVNRKNETVKVNLKANIKFNSEVETVDFEANVLGKEAVLPVEIYFIDLGKYGLSDCGESIYIKVGNVDVLVDAGDDIKTSNQAIKETIDSISEDKVLEYVIATHPDSDHIGGMPFLFENYEIKNLIQFNGDHTTNLYNEYKTSYTQEECTVCNATDSYNNLNGCKRGIELAPNVKIEILDTKNYDGKETNTRSVVCVLDAYGVRTLLTGDADNGSNKNLENDYKDTVGNIDILKAVHHATKEGTTIPFLEATDPEVVIICNGNYFGNKHGHPAPDAINRIYQYDNNIKIYAVVGGDSQECEVTSSSSYKCSVNDGYVDRNGTIKIVIDEAGYSISSEYYNDNPLELSNTYFWKNNEQKIYSYQGN